jgi:hypothetical protein
VEARTKAVRSAVFWGTSPSILGRGPTSLAKRWRFWPHSRLQPLGLDAARSAMLGLVGSKDAWLGEYEEAKTAADQVMELIHERSQAKETEAADAARLTGTVRRCVSIPTMS